MNSIEYTSPHDIHFPTPIRLEPDGLLPATSAEITLRPLDGSSDLPAQWDGNEIVFVVQNAKAGQTLRYEVVPGATTQTGVSLSDSCAALELMLPQGPFSTYHHGTDLVRPFLWPVLGPGQKRVTRDFPMEEADPADGADHEHHRSIWTAYEEVNDSCNWHERAGHGSMVHHEFIAMEEGPVFGGFTARIVWLNQSGQEVMDEVRQVRLYNAGDDYRLIDYDVTWSAAYADVVFGDTKEAGVLSIRVAPSMEGENGGRIANSEGGEGEGDCWGQPAAWCDYSGEVGGEVFGITIFDHPTNPNFPTRWHVRDYGLFATNPFSIAAFKAGDPSPYTLPRGKSCRFRYRILIRRGSLDRTQVASAFANFAARFE